VDEEFVVAEFNRACGFVSDHTSVVFDLVRS
jgi:hypothetical protein